LFISELNMLRAEVHVGLGWVAAISLVLMAVIFGSVMSTVVTCSLAHGRRGGGP